MVFAVIIVGLRSTWSVFLHRILGSNGTGQSTGGVTVWPRLATTGQVGNVSGTVFKSGPPQLASSSSGGGRD